MRSKTIWDVAGDALRVHKTDKEHLPEVEITAAHRGGALGTVTVHVCPTAQQLLAHADACRTIALELGAREKGKP